MFLIMLACHGLSYEMLVPAENESEAWKKAFKDLHGSERIVSVHQYTYQAMVYDVYRNRGWWSLRN